MKRPLLVTMFVCAFAGCALTPQGDGGGGAQGAGQWLKGDLHVHDDHSSDGSLPRQRSKDRAKGNNAVSDQIGQGERQGLDFMPLTDHRTYDQHYDPLWESKKLLLIPGEEANGAPHAIVLGGVDSVVQGADREQFAHIQTSIWDAHSQGATWTIAHPDDGEVDDKTFVPNARASVQGADLVEIWNKASSTEREIAYSENRWNLGYRFGVDGASDSHFRELWDRQGPGFPTSSVYAAARNERGVIEALRAGQTSLSFGPAGPFVELVADFGAKHAKGGDEVFVPAGTPGKLTIRVRKAAGMEVRLYRKPGVSAGPVKTYLPAGDDESYSIDIRSLAEPDWWRVEVDGMSTILPPIPDYNRPQPTTSVMELKAIASPIFVSTGPVAAQPELPIPADAGADDGAQLALGAAGAFAGFPDLAVDGAVAHLVAETHTASASTVVYRRRDAKGGWSQERTLSGTGLARFPRIAVHGKDVWVVWQEDATQVPHRPEIMLRHSADGGRNWAQAQTIRALDGRAEHPAIAITHEGTPVVVWQEIRAGEPFDVFLLEPGKETEPHNLSRAGKAFGPGQSDDSRSSRYPASVLPAIAVAADGRIAVAWQDDRTDIDPLWTGSAAAAGTNPDNWQIQVAVRVADKWAASVSLGASDMADRHPDIAFGGGELVAAWESKTLAPAGRNLAVMTAASRDGGVTFSAPAVLAPDPVGMGERPRLGVDADGSVRAVWYDSRSADWRWRVMTAVRRGGAWDRGRLINGKGVNTWPVTSGGAILFASTRNATRLQRDQTQQIFLLLAN